MKPSGFEGFVVCELQYFVGVGVGVDVDDEKGEE